MSKLTFHRLRNKNIERAAMWHPGFPTEDSWSLADWSNAMMGEAGEAANVVKKLRRQETGTRGRNDPELDALREQLGEELADTIIYADLLAAKLGINLAEAIICKFNKISVREGLEIYM